MSEFSIAVDGIEDVIANLAKRQADFSFTNSYLVGTGVEYSVYLEFGTRNMDPKPFFRPVISEIRSSGIRAFIPNAVGVSVESLQTVEQILQVLALAVERRLKEVITEKNLIDTGTLRASVTAVRGLNVNRLPTAEDFEGDNVPENKGREITSEAIEFDL